MNNIKVCVSIGDPSGIGPEIIAKLLLDSEFFAKYPFTPVAPKFVLDNAFEKILKTEFPDYPLIKLDFKPFDIAYGQHDARCGDIAMRSVKRAVELIQSGEFDALATTPINKHSIAMAGYKFPGHTEYLGYLTGSDDFSMMLASPYMRVIPVTIHIPVKNIAMELSADKIYTAVKNAHKSGSFFGKVNPAIAVTGLNPHSGDNGTIGTEEAEIIMPAINKAAAEGINVTGPYPADSLFSDVKRFDFIVTMYHDQALIPVKMSGFGNTVNVTLNLPIIRTSVDHGTAFDIAGKAVADTGSLKQAIITAHEMAAYKKGLSNV